MPCMMLCAGTVEHSQRLGQLPRQAVCQLRLRHCCRRGAGDLLRRLWLGLRPPVNLIEAGHIELSEVQSSLVFQHTCYCQRHLLGMDGHRYWFCWFWFNQKWHLQAGEAGHAAGAPEARHQPVAAHRRAVRQEACTPATQFWIMAVMG